MEMPKYSILLKITAIVFGTFPFVLVGLFLLLGGPNPGPTVGNPVEFIGFPLLLVGVFWALPIGFLLRVKLNIGSAVLLYILPGAFACSYFLWLSFSAETSSFFPSSLLGLVILAGIGSAAAYHFRAWKAEAELDYIKTKTGP
jgi:hypothetical protein